MPELFGFSKTCKTAKDDPAAVESLTFQIKEREVEGGF